MRQPVAQQVRGFRERWHPLFRLRRSGAFRYLLRRFDFPVWARLYGIPHRVSISAGKHSSLLFNPRSAEPEVVALFRAIHGLYAPRVFWDIGAYVGYYSFLLKAMDNRIKVVVFEPDSANRRAIERTINRYELQGIDVVAAAVSDSDGHKTFFADQVTGASGSLEDPARSFLRRNYGLDPSSITVRTVSLDNIRRSSEPADLIKIDVEGHEAGVIAGAEETLVRDQPVLVFECFDRESTLFAGLATKGYQIYDAERMTSDVGQATNYLALPPRFASDFGLLHSNWQEECARLWES